MSEVKKGVHVFFIDSTGKHRPAIVTNVFGPADKLPSINVAFVNDDDNQSDSYGNKIERATSVSHQSAQWAHGNMWRFVDEPHLIKQA